MKIGINAYPLIEPLTGIGNYLYYIVKFLEKNDSRNEYYLYANKEIKLPFSHSTHWNVRITKGFFSKSSTLWMCTKAKNLLLQDKIDLFWATASILPSSLKGAVRRTVLTVHDLTCNYFPQTLKWDNRIIFPLFFKNSLKAADKIIVDSKSTAMGLQALNLQINNKLSVIYLGVDEQFKPFRKIDSADYIAKKFNVSQNYILTVSTIDPRKNLNMLLVAFKAFLTKNPNFNLQLLIAGGKGWGSSPVYKTYRKLGFSRNQVEFLGYLNSQEDLIRLYCGSRLFIFLSLYEGFGLPLLEAMSCGSPVIASNINIFNEIANGAALFVNPNNPEEISEAIRTVLRDKSVADVLIERGFVRAKLFRWETTARETLDLLEKA